MIDPLTLVDGLEISVKVDPDISRFPQNQRSPARLRIVTDEIETLDIDHMTATIRGIAAAALPIIAGEATPTRIDPERLR